MIVPADRVRMATAPSTEIVFSSARLPLMLKPPLVNDGEPRVVEVAADDARLERRHANRVAAGEREQLDVLRLDRLPDRDVGLNRRGRGDDRDRFREVARLQRELHA